MALALAVVATGFAQKANVNKAKNKALAVENPDFQGAKDDIEAALVNDETKDLANTWYVAGLVYEKAADAEFILTQTGSGNTIQMGEDALKAYTYYLKANELDQLPDAKGKVAPKYSEFIITAYAQEFGQFYNAGAYYYGQENYEKAYYLFKMFIDASDKLYKAGIIGKDTVNVPVAAYNMSLCGMQIKNYDMVLSHVDMAMAHPDFASSAFRYKTAAYLEKGDTATWLNLCKEGTVKFPKDAYFNQALIQYYDNKGENDKLDALADELIASDPQNPLFVYLKGYIAQSKYERKEQKEQLDVAIEWYKKTLDVDGNYETALANLGRCYLLKAQAYSNEQSSTKITDKKKLAQDKEVLNGFYNEALPLYEKLRSIVPDKKEFWFNGLMNCYYNLNMEDKVAELEKLMPEE